MCKRVRVSPKACCCVPPPSLATVLAAVVTSGVMNWIWQVYVRDYVLQYLPVSLRGFVRDPPSRGGASVPVCTLVAHSCASEAVFQGCTSQGTCLVTVGCYAP